MSSILFSPSNLPWDWDDGWRWTRGANDTVKVRVVSRESSKFHCIVVEDLLVDPKGRSVDAMHEWRPCGIYSYFVDQAMWEDSDTEEKYCSTLGYFPLRKVENAIKDASEGRWYDAKTDDCGHWVVRIARNLVKKWECSCTLGAKVSSSAGYLALGLVAALVSHLIPKD